MPRKTLEPQQARSRKSMQKLLEAAAEIVSQYGLEGATIPRIAHRAGLTPGSIYRRFRDKEALIEAVILGILEKQDEDMNTGATPFSPGQVSLSVLAQQVISGMVATYRQKAGLLLAMKQFVQGQAGSAFREKASRLQVRYLEKVIDMFVAYREDIRHPNPRMAVVLGLKMVAGALYELVVWPTVKKDWENLLPKTDDALQRELTRAFLSYLGVENGKGTF